MALMDAGLAACVAVLFPLRWLLRPLLRSMRGGKRLSVWTGPPIINMAVNARAESLLGVRSVTVAPYTYFVTSQFDFNLTPSGPLRLAAIPLRYLACLLVCLFADRVHVYVDGGLLPQQGQRNFNRTELRLYHLLGVRTFAWTYGADVRVQRRTRALGEPNCCTDCTQVMRACVCSDSIGAANYEFVRRHVTAVFSMGDMIEYTPGSRNDLFFWPVDLAADGGRRYRPVYPDAAAARPLRIVHAPNHREFKGTRYIEQAVAELRAEGVQLELVLVERLPNAQALEIYREADLVVDQVLVGYHGYFALEAMALGKPVMCFIRDRGRYLLHPQECPMIDVHLGSLKETLRRWACADRSLLEGTGRAGRRYVEDNYGLDAFAARLATAYRELGVSV